MNDDEFIAARASLLKNWNCSFKEGQQGVFRVWTGSGTFPFCRCRDTAMNVTTMWSTCEVQG